MSQISPPVRILLVGAVAFLAAWFTVLRPKTDATIAPAATPAATATATATAKPTDAFGKAVAKAKHAAAQSGAASRRAGGETSTHRTQTQATTGAATQTAQAQAPVLIPPKVLDTLPAPVADGLRAHRTIVLGVIADGQTRLRPLADDDRYVRNALNKVNRYDGHVVVRRVTTDELVRFAPLVGDLHVDQTPSIVVIDAKLQGTVLSGYVDRISINQAIADARRNTITPLIADPYLRRLNTACSQWVTAQDRWSYPTIPGQKALTSSMNRRIALEHRYRSLVARIAAPARWRSLKSQFVSALDSYDASVARQANAVRTGDHAAYLSATASFDVGRFRKLDTRLDKLGVTSCVGNRRS